MFFISPESREAFEEVLLPQFQDLVQNAWQAEQVQVELGKLIDDCLERKNELYNMLIRYKPLQANDDTYFSDIKTAVAQWVSKW